MILQGSLNDDSAILNIEAVRVDKHRRAVLFEVDYFEG
jgi:hypothetical protein